MNLNKNNFYFIFYFLTVSLYGQQSKPKDTLAEVVITATRTPRQLSSLPLPVTLVSKEVINKSGSLRLNEILEEQTGIVMVPDQSGFEGVQIQGLESEFILILIDGVPLLRGQSAGNFDLRQIALGNIKQVEVVKGASSALYGSDALGGVINIITDSVNSENLTGFASYRYGTFEEQDANISLGQKIGKVGISAYANRFWSSGYDLNTTLAGNTVNPFENYTFGGKINYSISDKLQNITSVRTYAEYIDNSVTFEEELFSGNSKSVNWYAHNILKHQWHTNFKAEYELYFTQLEASDRLSAPAAVSKFFNTQYNQKLFRPEVRTYFRPSDKFTLTTGAGFTIENLARTNFGNPVNFNSQYVYTQAEIDYFKNLNIIVGARQDWHSEYQQQFSPKLALRYKLNNHFAVRGSVGLGFKAPDFRQLFLDFTNSSVGYTVLGRNVAANRLQNLETTGQITQVLNNTGESLTTPLLAQSSTSYNGGFTFQKRIWNFDFNFFRNEVENLIDTFAIARKRNGQNVFSYRNIGDTYFTGIELNGGVKPLKNLNITAGYQLLYAFDQEVRDNFEENPVQTVRLFPQPGNQLLFENVDVKEDDYIGLFNRSRHTVNFKLFYNWEKIKTNFSIRSVFRSAYGLFDTNANGFLDEKDSDNAFVDDFVITNVTATKKIKSHLELQIGTTNITDYQEELLPNMPGRRIFGKITYNF